MRHHSTPRRPRTAPSQRSRTRPVSPVRPLDDRPGAAALPRPDRAARALDVQVRQDLPRPLVSVAGELDLASAGLLTAMFDHVSRARSRRATPGSPVRDVEIDVDLSRVTFADTHGLAPVLQGRTRVVATSGPVRRVMALLQAAELAQLVQAGASEAPLAHEGTA